MTSGINTWIASDKAASSRQDEQAITVGRRICLSGIPRFYQIVRSTLIRTPSDLASMSPPYPDLPT